MSIRNKFSGIFKSFAYKVLDVDDTVVPQEQLDAMRDFLSRYKFNLKSKDLETLLKELQRKHLVDSVVVTRRDGTLVASSSGNGMREAITGTALFNYVSSEIPGSKTFSVKSEKDWFMLFPYNDHIYIVRAGADLSSLELRALAKEFDGFLKAENLALSF